MTLLMHSFGFDIKNDRPAVPRTHLGCSLKIVGKVDVLAGAGKEALFANGIEKAGRGAVVKGFWRRGGSQAEVDLDRVTLIGPDSFAVFGNDEAAFVVGLDDVLKLVAGDFSSVARELVEKVANVGPSLRIERDADGGGIVTEHPAEEFAGANGLLFVHGTRSKVVGRFDDPLLQNSRR